MSVEGIDAYFIGPMDLSAALGHMGDVNHPEVTDAIAHVLAIGKKVQKVAATYAFSVEDIQKKVEQGFQLISFGSASRLLMGSAREALAKIQEVIK